MFLLKTTLRFNKTTSTNLAACHKMSIRLASDTSQVKEKEAQKLTEDVLTEVKNDNKGLITLNRPRALNALTLDMIRVMYKQLREWQKNKNLDLILVKGIGGKAFCAGGDVRAVASAKSTGDSLTKDFFREEYILNHAIGTSRIPWVAFIDGIVMGGGVGISVHGHYRVATEKTMFAMPETAIGLIPDVGGGFFLPRLHNHLGTFLALTGHRLKGRDVYHAGIATHFVHSSHLSSLESDLLNLKLADKYNIQEVLDSYQNKNEDKSEFSLAKDLSVISEVFSSFAFEDIIDKLEAGVGASSEFCKKHLETLLTMSPTSQKVTLAQLERGSKMQTLKEVLEMEYEVVQKMMQGEDFFEGVRALLVDKDNKPKWKPSDFQKVSNETVQGHFNHLPPDQKLKIIHN